jgi:hypothetical protein
MAVPVFGEVLSALQVGGSLLVIGSGVLLASTRLAARWSKIRTW